MYYKVVVKLINLFIMFYNVLFRIGVNLEVDIVKCLSKVKNIIGIKEVSGNLE